MLTIPCCVKRGVQAQGVPSVLYANSALVVRSWAPGVPASHLHPQRANGPDHSTLRHLFKTCCAQAWEILFYTLVAQVGTEKSLRNISKALTARLRVLLSARAPKIFFSDRGRVPVRCLRISLGYVGVEVTQECTTFYYFVLAAGSSLLAVPPKCSPVGLSSGLAYQYANKNQARTLSFMYLLGFYNSEVYSTCISTSFSQLVKVNHLKNGHWCTSKHAWRARRRPGSIRDVHQSIFFPLHVPCVCVGTTFVSHFTPTYSSFPTDCHLILLWWGFSVPVIQKVFMFPMLVIYSV